MVQVNIERMSNARDGAIPLSRPQEEEQLIINLTAWQLPPDGDVSCNDTAAPVLNSLTKGAIFSDPLSPRDSQVLHYDGATNATLLLHTDSEGDSKSQSPSRPFLALMLPEWVHDKAAEDEAAGAFMCRSLSLKSFNTDSPTCSSTASLVSSCASSPLLPSKAELHKKSVRRSGVCWADLAESDEETLTGSFVSFNAASPTISSAGSLVNSVTSSPRLSANVDMHSPSVWRSGVSWADLAESEEEALAGTCGAFAANAPAPDTPTHLALQWQWRDSEGEALQVVPVH